MRSPKATQVGNLLTQPRLGINNGLFFQDLHAIWWSIFKLRRSLWSTASWSICRYNGSVYSTSE